MSAPYMPLYVADYLGDTQHLSTEEHGAYLLLLMALWRVGGELPEDDAKLARIVRLSRAKWLRIKPELIGLFQCSDGVLTHKRVTEELQKSSEISQKRARAGSIGGSSKALKSRNSGMANAVANGKQKPSSHSIPESEDTSSLRSDDARAAAREIEREFETAFWPSYPHKVGKAQARQAWTRARRKAPLTTIMDGLQRYVDSKPPDRNWCNPATFLNGERWLDEPQLLPETRAQGPPQRQPSTSAQLAAMTRPRALLK